MSKNNLYQSTLRDKNTKPFWGQEFLRDLLIPNLLGSDTHSILYWAGKRTAQKYLFSQRFDLIQFFAQTGWGKLRPLTQSSNLKKWQLNGPLIQKRRQNNPQCDFMLEAGFLAGFTERQLNMVAEATVKPASSGMIINVKIDPHDKLPKAKNNRHLKIIK